jgi:hypothetical protein
MEERLSWNKTFLGEMISNIETPEQATEALHVFDQLGLTQFKFGAWTRDSPVIKKLKKWYGPMNETSASASASGRKTRRVRRKRSNKKTNKRKGRRSNRKTNKRN